MISLLSLSSCFSSLSLIVDGESEGISDSKVVTAVISVHGDGEVDGVEERGGDTDIGLDSLERDFKAELELDVILKSIEYKDDFLLKMFKKTKLQFNTVVVSYH